MKLFKFIFSVLIIAFVGSAISMAASVPFAVGIGGVTLSSMIPKKEKGVLLMALDVEIWKPWIVEQLFANNDFLNLCQNADEHVLNGKVVHIPNAGSPSGVKKNRSSLPATVTRRKDIDVTYALNEFTSNPRLLEDADKILSYNKMNSAMGQDMRYIADLIAKDMLYNWRPAAAKIIDTSGANIATHLTGRTGNRKKFLLDNLQEAESVMDDDDIPAGDRYSIMSSRMHQQLVSQLSVGDYKDFSRAYDEQKGIIGELFGFKIIKRSYVLHYDNAAAALDPDPDVYAAAVTDNDAVLCWHIDTVERALGTTELFEKKKDPTYYGDIYSLLARSGGRRVRNDNKGVVAIVQKNV